MSYISNADGAYYTAEIDAYGITDEMMTDQGVPVGDLHPIGDCSLTPGDPSPVGRTHEGDLAYVIFPTKGELSLTRRDWAHLAHLQARAARITKVPEWPYDGPTIVLFMRLLNEAVPHVYFQASNHDEMTFKAAQLAVIEGRLDDLPDILG